MSDWTSEIRDLLKDPDFPAMPLSAHGIDAHRREWAEDADGRREVLEGGQNAYGLLSDYVDLINAVPRLLSDIDRITAGRDGWKAALQKIALLDEAGGHELTDRHAMEAVSIATHALGKHPSEILRETLAHSDADGAGR